MAETRVFGFAPGLELRLAANPPALRHFTAEYEPVQVAHPDGPAAVDVEVTRRAGHAPQALVLRGGYKTARWEVALDPAAGDPLRARITLRGRPLTFGLSLVQGYFVEPLLSIAAARREWVLLPAAAIADETGALLLMGRSRAGKSSLAARALVVGKDVLGDDQVLIDGAGRCLPFPRRMRFYSDLRVTAPQAYSRLPAAVRTALTARRIVRTLTRGYVAPPVRVAVATLAERRPLPAQILHVVLVERDAAADAVQLDELGADEAVEAAADLLREQRARLEPANDSWRDALAEAAGNERRILARALAARTVRRAVVPDGWTAARAIAQLAEALGTER